MAITSYGYPTSITPGSVYAQANQAAGNRYSFLGFTDFRVTPAASGTRRVNISAGWAQGKGVLVNLDAATTLDLPAPSGTSQWFLVGLKRWTDNPDYPDPSDEPYISELISVAGTSSRTVPSVTQDAGDDDTQWIALCRVNNSSTLVQEVVDLRLVTGEGGGGYTVFSPEALDQLDPIVGARVYRADVGFHYDRVSSPSGTLSWSRPGVWQNWTPTFNTGNVTLREARYSREGDTVHVVERVFMHSMGSGDQSFTSSVPVTGRAMTGWVDVLGGAGGRRFINSGAHLFNGFVVANGSGPLNQITVVSPQEFPEPAAWGVRNNSGYPVPWGDQGAEVSLRYSYEAA